MVKILELCAVDFTAYHLLRPLGLGLRGAGYDVTFCCSPGEGLDLLRAEGFGAEAIPISRNYNVAHHARSFEALLSFMRRERFSIVHAHTPVAGLIGRGAAKLAGVPGIVYTAHGFYFHDGMPSAVHAFFAGLERCAAAFTDVIFVQSEEDWEEAVRLRIAPRVKLVHIGNGVDPEKFGKRLHSLEAARFREENGLGSGPVVGFVGRAVREKGAIEFVRAAAIVKRSSPGAKFVMVGEPLVSDRDSCWDEILRLRGELGLDGDLILTGYRKDVPAILAAFDVFALPSYREGMPRALLEAMATGLPVVATAIRGCREEVANGSTGILVPSGDHEALAAAIGKFALSSELRASMGEAGRERVLARFDERKIVALQIALLERLAEAKLRKARP
ncbi:MAG: glycosyltransferase family 4 protein [Candidatus Krumholzibacteria bacterium]|nr:glycosyltransferase family 4 protein [Candidatus Krumholzibacteria bacterium]